jgi:hypothetical protein
MDFHTEKKDEFCRLIKEYADLFPRDKLLLFMQANNNNPINLLGRNIDKNNADLLWYIDRLTTGYRDNIPVDVPIDLKNKLVVVSNRIRNLYNLRPLTN